MSTLGAVRRRLARVTSRAKRVLEPALPRILDPRFPGKALFEYRTALGTYFLPVDTENDCIAADMRAGRVFEPEIVNHARAFVAPGTIVLDVGSNFGQMALLFADMVGNSGQVLAFEADEFIYSVLCRNLDANRADNVRAYFGAVYDEGGKLLRFPEQDFKRFPAYGSYGLDPAAISGREVPSVAIDDLELPGPISFMKVDVQGSDLFALRGARRTILRHRMPIVFEYEEQFQSEFGTCFQDYLDFLRDVGYRIDRTIYGINYLATPDPRTSIAVPDAAAERRPRLSLELGPSIAPRHCAFLQSRAEVDTCTAYLHRNGYVSHIWPCKDWDIAHVIREIGDGNVLDMGSSDSYILKNLRLKRIAGELFGIDLRPPERALPGVRYLVGDLTAVPVQDGFFDFITCLSVIEHEVDVHKLAAETARLLRPGGRLFLTFDYWEPAVHPSIDLYGLRWQPLDRAMVEHLIEACRAADLALVDNVDWKLGDAVIRDGYYSPEKGIAYTFGMLQFVRRAPPAEAVSG